jgi:WD40 repeat protein
VGATLRPVGRGAFSRAGHLLVVSGRNKVEVLDISNPQQPKALAISPPDDTQINGIAISADGARVVTAGEDGMLRMFEAETLHQIGSWKGGIGRLLQPAFSDDGRLVLASGDPNINATVVWEVASGRLLSRIEGIAGEFSHDDRSVLTLARGDSVQLRRRQGGTAPIELQGVRARVTNLRFSHDGKVLLGVTSDGALHLWNGQTGALISSVREQATSRGAALSPDGRWVVTDDGRLWNPWRSRRDVLLHASVPAVGPWLFSPDGKYVLGATDEPTSAIVVLRMPTDAGAASDVVKRLGHSSQTVNMAAFSPDGRFVAAALSNDFAVLWELDGANRSVELRGHASNVTALAFSPDSRWLATTDQGGGVRVWETMTGKIVAELMGHTADVIKVEFAANGEHIVTLTGGFEPSVHIFECAICGSPDALLTRVRARQAVIR